MQKILVTPKSFHTYKDRVYPLFKEHGFELLENTLGRTMTEKEIIDCSKDEVVGIIVGIDPLSAEVLEQCQHLRAISKYGVGMDNIDLKKAAELGIMVINAAGSNGVSVAELAIALTFAMARNISSIVSTVKEGGWERVIGVELTGKKMGLIGGGQIGREVAKRTRGLEMSVAIFDPYFNDKEFLEKHNIQKYDHLEHIFMNSDIISLHVPVTSETKGIISKQALQLMKPTAFLVNTSRGELVYEEALYEALVEKRIAGAAQDVFSSEPPGKDNKLLALDNFILTSHIGAFTHEGVEKMVMASSNNLLEMLNKQ